MSLAKKGLLGLAIILISMQFFQPSRNQTSAATDAHIERLYTAPKNVSAILARSCYDCHSDHTRYPWYSGIQPGAWYMARHIRNGKEALNFSDFGTYSARMQRNKFRSMSGQVKKGEMPLPSYTLIHRDAALSEADKQVLIAWFDALADQVK